MFFFVVNVGALQNFAEAADPASTTRRSSCPWRSSSLSPASRGPALVIDIQDGYFDRLLLTPVRRPALLLGLMVADFALVIALSIPVLLLGLRSASRSRPACSASWRSCCSAGFWGLAFTGFPYAIALKTGNPAAVNSSFLLFFPFLFLTTAFLPRSP